MDMLNHYILISSCGYTVIEVKVWLGLGTWISWLGLESNVLGFAALFGFCARKSVLQKVSPSSSKWESQLIYSRCHLNEITLIVFYTS